MNNLKWPSINSKLFQKLFNTVDSSSISKTLWSSLWMAGDYFTFHLNVELSMSNSFTHMQIWNQEIKVIEAVPKFTKNYITTWKPQKWNTLFLSKSVIWWSLYLYRREWILWVAGGKSAHLTKICFWSSFESPMCFSKCEYPKKQQRKMQTSRTSCQRYKTRICVDGVLEFASFKSTPSVLLLSTKIWGECEYWNLFENSYIWCNSCRNN